MVRVIKPRYYPHRSVRSYTLMGFRTRVRKRLMGRGFKRHEVARLEQLYFCQGLSMYLDEQAVYRNVRRSRLYRMSRQLKADRKRPIFELVLRSGLFFCYLDEEGRMLGFVSPFCLQSLGIISF